MINPDKKWCFRGISAKKKDFHAWSYCDREVVGISDDYDYKPFGCKHNKAKFNPSKFGNCEIDMYLDLDIDELRMCIVGKHGSDQQHAQEAIWYNISDICKSGWVPHFNFDYYTADTQRIQIATIPIELYGKEAMMNWNQDVSEWDAICNKNA